MLIIGDYSFTVGSFKLPRAGRERLGDRHKGGGDPHVQQERGGHQEHGVLPDGAGAQQRAADGRQHRRRGYGGGHGALRRYRQDRLPG